MGFQQKVFLTRSWKNSDFAHETKISIIFYVYIMWSVFAGLKTLFSNKTFNHYLFTEMLIN